jgi:hypothetical protein
MNTMLHGKYTVKAEIYVKKQEEICLTALVDHLSST